MPSRHPLRVTVVPLSRLMLVALAGLFVSANIASAHPVPAAQAVLNLYADGKCELRITCDVSALVMQTMPGHLGEAAKELQALSAAELVARVEDARQAVEYYVELKFDGARQKLTEIEMPALAVIRGGAAHGGEEAWPAILLHGTWPAAAKTCAITFPAAIGRVQFKLVREGETHYTRELAAGKSSGSLSLTDTGSPQAVSKEDWAGWIMVALLLAYIVRLYVGRPKHAG